jgi:hypothetical protein
VSHHSGKACNEQCPDFDMPCPEIDGDGLKEDDDRDSEEQGVDDADKLTDSFTVVTSW